LVATDRRGHAGEGTEVRFPPPSLTGGPYRAGPGALGVFASFPPTYEARPTEGPGCLAPLRPRLAPSLLPGGRSVGSNVIEGRRRGPPAAAAHLTFLWRGRTSTAAG
jgi:hypothetical protein